MKQFIYSIMLLMFINVNGQNVSIYDIQGQTDNSPYVDQSVTTKGLVTAVFSTGYFINDGDSAWCGLYVFDNTQLPAVGDSITVTGTITEYYGMTEMKTITSFQVLNSGNNLPAPVVIQTGDATEAYESVFVKVVGATCTNADLGYGEWELNDGSGAVSVDDLGVAYSPTAGVKYTVTGPLNYSYSAYKIEPPTADDIVVAENIFLTSDIKVTDITQNSIKLQWSTNDLSTSEVEFGITQNFELGHVVDTNLTINHSVVITGLSANQIIYTKPYSVKGTDTTANITKLFTTESTSSGKINVYFNHEVDHSVATNEQAVAIPGHFADTIISYINKAQTSLDITMYDINDTVDNRVINIFHAINSAYDRGVAVRYITDDQPENILLDSLNPNINIVRGNTAAIMHDKFMVIDANDVNNSWVLTGSTNHTIANLISDYNNIICIQDVVIAKAFELEFNEMWGGSQLTPNLELSKFGADKTDNTPHVFKSNGKTIEVYFSPSDNTSAHIQQAIANAQTDLEFGVLVFTDNNLGQEVIDAHNRGVDVRGIVDYTQYSGDETGGLITLGLNVVAYKNADGSEWPIGATFHHKYAIIDRDSDSAVLITGSHNWSASADSKNDENTIIIHDKTIANLYHQEFIKRFDEQKQLLTIKGLPMSNGVTIFPNPSADKFTVLLNKSVDFGSYYIYNISGQQILEGKFSGNSVEVVHSLKSGLYVIMLKSNTNVTKQTFVVK